MEAGWKDHPERRGWEDIARIVGSRRVDLFAPYQGRAVLHGANLVHRPVLQSYAALTDDLAGRNAAFFRDPGAPEVVLLDP